MKLFLFLSASVATGILAAEVIAKVVKKELDARDSVSYQPRPMKKAKVVS